MSWSSKRGAGTWDLLPSSQPLILICCVDLGKSFNIAFVVYPSVECLPLYHGGTVEIYSAAVCVEKYL